MKTNNKKWLATLMLVGAISAATVGASLTASADETQVTETPYNVTSIFLAQNGAVVGAEKPEGAADDAAKITAFTLADDDRVIFRNDLAFKWFESKGQAKYLSLAFAFKDLNFETLTLKVESESAWATKDGKAENTVTFINKAGAISVKVNDGNEKTTAIAANADIRLRLTEENSADEIGKFSVMLQVAENAAEEIGTFENIGGYFSEYENGSTDKKYPLSVTAEIPANAATDKNTTVFLLKEINGQRFDNVKTTVSGETTTFNVIDTAAPVLVVNEEVNGFTLGTAFALDYEVVDVLQSSNLTKTLKYYQYNPTDAEKSYKDLSTTTRFMDTVYYLDGSGNAYAEAGEGRTAVSVYDKENGKEFVSVTFTLGDKAFAASAVQKTYDLSWYANKTETKTVGKDDKAEDIDFIVADRTVAGATYKFIDVNTTDKVNVVTDQAALDAQIKVFEEELAKAAKDVYVGKEMYIPSMKWLFADDGGYTNLKFTISYKTRTSSEKTASSLSYNGLKFSVSEEGEYEFKIFANDKAGNTMKYYLDGEEVSVSTSNVWKIEEIPSFTFKIANKGLKVDDGEKVSDRKDSEVLDKTYKFSDLKVVGATSLQENYKLYKINDANKIGLKSVLANVTYDEILATAKTRYGEVKNGDYMSLWLNVYAEKLAVALGNGVTAEQVKACFVEIEEFNDKINEEEHADAWAESDNKFNWSSSSQSFKTAEEGTYVILADYCEKEIPSQRATAYMVITVQSKTDEVKGDAGEWLKNNLVSVILFAIAGVLLIVIIILFLIKPSDETLEDLDEKEEKEDRKKEKEE